ncbi:MAG: MFS transporter [Anaerolineales bacterium]|nr:MFS transporter [Anaerolineales bacterium]
MSSIDTTLSTGLPAGRSSKTAAYYLAFVALGLTSATLGPTLPNLAEHTRSNLREISYLFTARSLGYLIGSFLGGRLFDRKPGHPVMALMLVGMVAALVVIPLIPALWLLIAVMLFLGLVEGAVDVGGNTLLVWVHRHRVGPYMNGLHFFFGVGAFLSPLIVAQPFC